jgi:riboflavin synthase
MSWLRWYGSAVFTGLVQSLGEIHSKELHGGCARLWIHAPFEDLVLGESIAVDGACLTVKTIGKDCFEIDVSPETLERTIAGQYELGTKVHLERALRMGDRLGGHWVTGHVDTQLAVSRSEARGDCLCLRFEGVAQEERAFLSEKGSVCLSGVSLTVNTVSPSGFEVLLVPHTLEHTHLKSLQPGSLVNVEWDWMAKVVVGALALRFPEKEKHADH